MESLGIRLRRQRRRLGLTLDELSGRTGISKPYLSLIETGRVPNPPSDEKLGRLEQALGFPRNQLISQAHLQRTPQDVRAALQTLMAKGQAEGTAAIADFPFELPAAAPAPAGGAPPSRGDSPASIPPSIVPIINRAAAGYPRDFADLSYPRAAADDYITCPDVHDKDAFAARVCGDTMNPKYREGDIVIFCPALTVRNGDDCFVRFADGRTTFHRVFFESDENGAALLRLQPRNERHRPQIVPSEQVAGLYKAVYRYQRVDEES